MQRIAQVLLVTCAVAAASRGAAEDAPDPSLFDSKVRPFLKKHCFACHGDSDGEAGVDLSQLHGKFANADECGLWLKALDQLQADLMPPYEEPRPESRERGEVIRWIESSVIASEHGRAHRMKMRLPSRGNYVDHELLFSGTIEQLPYTPARIWRASPYIFDQKKIVSKSIKSLQNPFTFSTPGNGIRDYAATSTVGASVVETIVLNANAEIEFQLAQAEQEPENPSAKRRRPNLFAPFVKEGAVATDEQMEAVISATFGLVVSRAPSDDELAKYVGFLKKNLSDTADPRRSLKATLAAIYLSPETIYRMEWGLGPADEHGRRMLSPPEIAYALSYALFDTGPTEGGRRASEKAIAEAWRQGRLSTKADVARVVEEILRDERYPPIAGQQKDTLPRVMRFFREFFGYHHAVDVFKDQQRINEHGLYHDPRRLVVDADNLIKVILRRDRRVFEQLLTTNGAMVFHDGDNQAQIDRHEALLADLKSYDENRVKRDIAKRKAGVLKKPKYKSNPALVPQEMARIERDGQTLLRRKKAEYQRLLKSGVTMQSVKNRDRQYMRAYNLNPRTWKWPAAQPFNLPAEQRAGILTHPAWLVAHSTNDDTDPVHRGIWIHEKLLAGVIGDVPPDVDARIPDDPHKTLRERLSVVRNEACWKCHRKINPLGEAFEIFDDFGRYRSQHYFDEAGQIVTRQFNTVPAADGKGTALQRIERDKLVAGGQFTARPVDGRGSFDTLGIPGLHGNFDNALEMIHAIAGADRVRQSIIRHLFRYLMGRNEMLSDSQTLMDADRAYVESGGSFKAVVVSLLSSDSFLYRR